MDGENGENTLQQMVGEMAQHQVLRVSEGMGATEGVEENMNCLDGVDSHGGVGFSASGGEGDSNAKRKRGRPKKQQEVEVPGEHVAMAEASSASSQKRGRGRPKGSGKLQTLAASLSGNALETAGSNFTPHTVTIQTGENIVQRIVSFTQKSSESVCILSASGPICTAELRRHGSCGETVLRYEGRFEIVTLSGSCANNGMSNNRQEDCLLSVQLANPDGALFGGPVGDSLIAGGPIQLIIAIFRQKSREKAKVKNPNKVAATTTMQAKPSDELPAAEANGHQTVPHSLGQSIDAVEKFIIGHDNHASLQPFDWTLLQSSVPMSQHVMSDFHTGVH